MVLERHGGYCLGVFNAFGDDITVSIPGIGAELEDMYSETGFVRNFYLDIESNFRGFGAECAEMIKDNVIGKKERRRINLKTRSNGSLLATYVLNELDVDTIKHIDTILFHAPCSRRNCRFSKLQSCQEFVRKCKEVNHFPKITISVNGNDILTGPSEALDHLENFLSNGYPPEHIEFKYSRGCDSGMSVGLPKTLFRRHTAQMSDGCKLTGEINRTGDVFLKQSVDQSLLENARDHDSIIDQAKLLYEEAIIKAKDQKLREQKNRITKTEVSVGGRRNLDATVKRGISVVTATSRDKSKQPKLTMPTEPEIIENFKPSYQQRQGRIESVAYRNMEQARNNRPPSKERKGISLTKAQKPAVISATVPEGYVRGGINRCTKQSALPENSISGISGLSPIPQRRMDDSSHNTQLFPHTHRRHALSPKTNPLAGAGRNYHTSYLPGNTMGDKIEHRTAYYQNNRVC